MAFHFVRTTPRGEGGVAVFDLWGDGAVAALATVFRPRAGGLPDEGRIRIGDLVDPGGEPVDEALLSRVPAAGSWCGLGGWALTVHGGLWIARRVEELLRAAGGIPLSVREALDLSVRLGGLDGIRAAAFDLLLAARTDRAARFLARQHRGELSAAIREAVAGIDAGRPDRAEALLGDLLRAARQARRLWSPLRVLLAGRPNAGKSTLFNLLAGEERAAVSAEPGTTRDTLEALVAMEDYPVLLADGPGMRPLDSVGAIEREGIARVLALKEGAFIWLVPHPWRAGAEDRAFLDRLPPGGALVAASLCDLDDGTDVPPGLRISARTGEGIEALRRAIVREWIDDRPDPTSEIPCAAFTQPLADRIREAAESLRSGDLDGVRSALVESLRASWLVPEVAPAFA